MALKSKTLTQGRYPLSFMLQPGPGNISYDNVTILAGQVLPAGSVLGIVTASGKFSVYNDSASDGTQVAAGILCYAVDATNPSADAAGVVCVRQAEVIADELYFPSGTGDTAKTHAYADLKAIGVIARPSIPGVPAP
jgi:Bacteriophage lambda head decoration protein D